LNWFEAVREFYVTLSTDRVLHGFRNVAGRPAPGRGLAGWCAKDASMVFGQWLSALARFSVGPDGAPARDKAEELYWGWRELDLLRFEEVFQQPALDPHYSYEKLMFGLVDLFSYMELNEAKSSLVALLEWGTANLSHNGVPAADGNAQGTPMEWYTLSESAYRAYQLTGEGEFKTFAESWCYDEFWKRFLRPGTESVAGLHAYSHVNTLSGLAMRYLVDGSNDDLTALVNAHDFFRRWQCYATGGFGPGERLVSDGYLGSALDLRSDSFEAPCGSWAVLKLCRYLLELTGQAKFGDWMEQVLYNGILASLLPTSEGENFYYADYRPSGGIKVYDVIRFACCSGTLGQAVADYRGLIYFTDGGALLINLLVPSQLKWTELGDAIEVSIKTSYPEEGAVRIEVRSPSIKRWPLKVRVPEWSGGWTVRVNGVVSSASAQPGQWIVVNSLWTGSDVVELDIPLEFREVPVDHAKPNRIALVRGPAVYVLDAQPPDRYIDLPQRQRLENGLVTDPDDLGAWKVLPDSASAMESRLRPFHAVAEGWRYRMYFDRDQLPAAFW
jgi:hypothetical protein